MKEKNLMIKDLIFHNGYTHGLHISRIDDGFVWVEESFAGDKVWKQESLIYAEDITPIPLTAEILERNGFVEEGNLEEGMWFKHPKWNLTLSFYEVWNVVDIVLGNEIGFCKISFVHQLQHALRLCGLNELADNFQVE